MLKSFICFFILLIPTIGLTQAWKTLPKGVRIIGIRNVTTNDITSTFNQSKSSVPLGTEFRIDAPALDSALSGAIKDWVLTDPKAYNHFLAAEYAIDAKARFNVQGFGFGWGLTDKVMFYSEIAYYNARVNVNINRTKGNNFKDTALIQQTSNLDDLQNSAAAGLENLTIDATEEVLQSVVTNEFGYKPVGDWRGQGYGDMETGLMIKVIDRGFWGLMLYPGVVLPTGREDDPDIIQDVAFGDGQFDIFQEVGIGYIFNDKFSVGSFLRYTHQFAADKTLRVPYDESFPLSSEKGRFNVQYGDRISLNLNSTYTANSWLSFTPVYRYIRQAPAKYNSEFSEANRILSKNTDWFEHQGQITASLSGIQPFLRKKFPLPAQLNFNYVRTLSGKNIPDVSRIEFEIRMIF